MKIGSAAVCHIRVSLLSGILALFVSVICTGPLLIQVSPQCVMLTAICYRENISEATPVHHILMSHLMVPLYQLTIFLYCALTLYYLYHA